MLWDRAVWAGPPDGNYNGPAVEQRGLIEHIAEGSYLGTISWQRNPVSRVSSHFVIGLGGFRTGEVSQLLDTSITAWTQGAGNGFWVSVENAGWHTGQLTADQVEANAQLYAWLMLTHGAPATLAGNPNGRGLGWHGMGGAAWGNHPLCPGPANVALLPTILARAVQIVNGEGSDMQKYFLAVDDREGPDEGTYWLCDGMFARGPLVGVGTGPAGRNEALDIKELARQGMFELWRDPETGADVRHGMTEAFGLKVPRAFGAGPGGLVPHTHDVPAIEVPAVTTGPADPE